MSKGKSFWFHYNKPASRAAGKPQLTIHYNKRCIIVDGIECRVPSATRIRKTQPRCVVAGKGFVRVENGIAVIDHKELPDGFFSFAVGDEVRLTVTDEFLSDIQSDFLADMSEKDAYHAVDMIADINKRWRITLIDGDSCELSPIGFRSKHNCAFPMAFLRSSNG